MPATTTYPASPKGRPAVVALDSGGEQQSRGEHKTSERDSPCLYELLERLDLDPGRPFGALSKDNRQKVGLVQAFQSDPEVLILDEPPDDSRRHSRISTLLG
jgi:ATPase subunit of ABC transporter with duplicated ATPase domains